ncbi:tyrosine-protein phosphatase [Yinghuangia aomiensis]
MRSDHERLHRPWPTLPDGVAYGTVAVTPGPQATAPAAPATAAAAPGTTGTFGAREFGLWYGTLATASAADLAAAVRAIAAPDAPPVLIHCTAGKDRTGILVALLLDLVGVQRPEIVADYTRSQAALSEIRARTGVVVPGMDFDAMPEVVMAAPAETIETFLDTLPAGGARELLAPHGIDAATVGALRGRLLH